MIQDLKNYGKPNQNLRNPDQGSLMSGTGFSLAAIGTLLAGYAALIYGMKINSEHLDAKRAAAEQFFKSIPTKNFTIGPNQGLDGVAYEQKIPIYLRDAYKKAIAEHNEAMKVESGLPAGHNLEIPDVGKACSKYGSVSDCIDAKVEK